MSFQRMSIGWSASGKPMSRQKVIVGKGMVNSATSSHVRLAAMGSRSERAASRMSSSSSDIRRGLNNGSSSRRYSRWASPSLFSG